MSKSIEERVARVEAFLGMTDVNPPFASDVAAAEAQAAADKAAQEAADAAAAAEAAKADVQA